MVNRFSNYLKKNLPMIFRIAGVRNHSVWPLVPCCAFGGYARTGILVGFIMRLGCGLYLMRATTLYSLLLPQLLHTQCMDGYQRGTCMRLMPSYDYHSLFLLLCLSPSLSVCQSGRSDDVPMNGSTPTNKQMNAQAFESPSMWKRLRKVYNLMKSVVCACPKFVGELREWKWLSVCDHSWMHTGFWSNSCGLDPLSVFYDYLHKLQCAVIVWNARAQWTHETETEHFG